MPLTQAEADHLLALAKEFVENDPLIYPYTQPLSYDRALRSIDRREEFFLTVERGNRKRARLNYQTRGRDVIVLARVEFNGRAHRNPPDSPYRPGERMECPTSTFIAKASTIGLPTMWLTCRRWLCATLETDRTVWKIFCGSATSRSGHRFSSAYESR